MRIEVDFPGGKRVDAHFKNFTVQTDQPAELGGEAGAPTPFAYFLSSIATCAGIFALTFCQKRGLDTEGLKLTAEFTRDPETKRLTDVELNLKLPKNFPEKYVKPIIRTMEQCSVKKALHSPPDFKLSAS